MIFYKLIKIQSGTLSTLEKKITKLIISKCKKLVIKKLEVLRVCFGKNIPS